MSWYLAKIVYEVICGKGEHCPQFNEQLRLIAATNAQDALQVAARIGREEGISFTNHSDLLVQWKFLDVPELLPLEPLLHGAELFSSIREIDYPEGYRCMIRDHAALLHQKISDGAHPLF